MNRSLIFASLLATLAFPAGAENRAFTLEDGLAMNQFVGRMPIDLTPDGRFLTYGLQSKHRDLDVGGGHYLPTGVHGMVAGTEIHLTDVAEGSHRNLTSDWGSSWAPRWSPDGAKLAFYSDRSGRPLLYIWDRKLDHFTAVDGAVVRTFFSFEVPTWSPDGRYVYYRALSQAVEDRYAAEPESWPWEKALRAESQAAPETEDAPGPSFVEVHDARPSSTTTTQAVSPNHNGTKGKPAETAHERGRGIIDVVRADVMTGEVTRLLSGYAVRTLYLSPNGEHLFVSVQLGMEKAGAQQPLFALYVVPTHGSGTRPGLADDGLKPLVSEIRGGYGISMAWAPDSTRLAYVTIGPLAEGNAFVVDVLTGISTNVTEGLDINLGDSLEIYDPPLWTPDGRHLIWLHRGELWRIAADGSGAAGLTETLPALVAGIVRPSESGIVWLGEGSDKAVVQTFAPESNRGGFAHVDLASGEAIQIIEQERRYSGQSVSRYHLEVAESTGTVIFRSESSTEPADLYSIDPSSAKTGPKSIRRVTEVNPSLSQVDLGDLHMLRWTLANGVDARGILLVPAGTRKETPVPLVVWIYGGSRPSQHLRRFGLGKEPATDNPRLFTGRGFAVLLPDMPLEKTTTEKTYDPLAAHVRAALPALDAAVATGLVDGNRIGVFGHSYGGYGVNVMITQTDRFAAAVSSTGSANLTSGFLRAGFEFGSTGWFESGQGRMGVPLWENSQRYVENSPVFFLDKVQTPLLLVHSEDDDAYQQSVEMYGGLKRLGKSVTLASYKNAHHFYGAWSNEKLTDFWQRVLDWFEHYLQDEKQHAKVTLSKH